MNVGDGTCRARGVNGGGGEEQGNCYFLFIHIPKLETVRRVQEQKRQTAVTAGGNAKQKKKKRK